MSKVRRKVTVEDDDSFIEQELKGDNYDRNTQKPSVFERLGASSRDQLRVPETFHTGPNNYHTGVCRHYSRTGNCPYGPSCRFPHVSSSQGRERSESESSGEKKREREQGKNAMPASLSPKKSTKKPQKDAVDSKTVKSAVVMRSRHGASDSDSPDCVPWDSVDERKLEQKRRELEHALKQCEEDNKLAIGKKATSMQILGGMYDSTSSAGHTPDTSARRKISPAPATGAAAVKKQKLKKDKKKKSKLKALLAGGTPKKTVTPVNADTQPDRIRFKVDDALKHRRLSSPKLDMFKNASPELSDGDAGAKSKTDKAVKKSTSVSPKPKVKRFLNKSQSPSPVKTKRAESVESKRTSSKSKHKKKELKRTSSSSESASSGNELEKRVKKGGKKKKEKKRRRESTDDVVVTKKKKKKTRVTKSDDSSDEDEAKKKGDKTKAKKKRREESEEKEKKASLVKKADSLEVKSRERHRSREASNRRSKNKSVSRNRSTSRNRSRRSKNRSVSRNRSSSRNKTSRGGSRNRSPARKTDLKNRSRDSRNRSLSRNRSTSRRRSTNRSHGSKNKSPGARNRSPGARPRSPLRKTVGGRELADTRRDAEDETPTPGGSISRDRYRRYPDAPAERRFQPRDERERNERFGRRPPFDGAPGHSAPGHSAQGHSAPGHSAPGHSAPGHSAPGHSAPGHSAPGHSAPVHSATGHSAPGHSAPGHSAPGHSAPGHSAPGHSAEEVPRYPRGERVERDAPERIKDDRDLARGEWDRRAPGRNFPPGRGPEGSHVSRRGEWEMARHDNRGRWPDDRRDDSRFNRRPEVTSPMVSDRDKQAPDSGDKNEENRKRSLEREKDLAISPANKRLRETSPTGSQRSRGSAADKPRPRDSTLVDEVKKAIKDEAVVQEGAKDTENVGEEKKKEDVDDEKAGSGVKDEGGKGGRDEARGRDDSRGPRNEARNREEFGRGLRDVRWREFDMRGRDYYSRMREDGRFREGDRRVDIDRARIDGIGRGRPGDMYRGRPGDIRGIPGEIGRGRPGEDRGRVGDFDRGRPGERGRDGDAKVGDDFRGREGGDRGRGHGDVRKADEDRERDGLRDGLREGVRESFRIGETRVNDMRRDVDGRGKFRDEGERRPYERFTRYRYREDATSWRDNRRPFDRSEPVRDKVEEKVEEKSDVSKPAAESPGGKKDEAARRSERVSSDEGKGQDVYRVLSETGEAISDWSTEDDADDVLTQHDDKTKGNERGQPPSFDRGRGGKYGEWRVSKNVGRGRYGNRDQQLTETEKLKSDQPKEKSDTPKSESKTANEAVDILAEFEAISDEEDLGDWDDEDRTPKDALDIDWASLMTDTRPKVTTTGSALQRFTAAAVLSRIGVSKEYAREALFKRLEDVCREAAMTDGGEMREESNDDASTKETAEVKRPVKPFTFLHDIAAFHAASVKRNRTRATLLHSIGLNKGPLYARKDLDIRRQLCRLDKLGNET